MGNGGRGSRDMDYRLTGQHHFYITSFTNYFHFAENVKTKILISRQLIRWPQSDPVLNTKQVIKQQKLVHSSPSYSFVSQPIEIKVRATSSKPGPLVVTAPSSN